MSIDDVALLAAGGVLALERAPGRETPADVVEARTYVHPALTGRTVVRVVAQNLARGVDLEMETIGFSAGERSTEVGRERRRALGFPGWALVHDPKNARYALEVVRDLKKAARRAKSKPGHAKEAIDAIAETLGKSVPGFLPSFFEETGRAFLDAEAHSYAAQYFEKAREAERVHALVIDEDTRRDAFLEFALAGAVSIKSLSAYAKDLEKAREPAEAYQQFRRLCVQRTLGGLPPWGGMAKELSRLAKLAGLDVAAEARSVVGEILESPSLKRAPADFWTAYDAPIVELARTSPKIRGALLALFPQPSAGADGFEQDWLALLERSGALDALYDAAQPADAQPSDGAAAWISAMHTHTRRGWRATTLPARMFAIVAAAAPRIRAEGKPLAFVGRYGREVDIDLSEHALALGLPVADPVPLAKADFATWASGASERGRDPLHFVAHPTLGPLVGAGLDAVVGTQPFEAVARGKTALLAARRAWLMDAIASASGALPSLESALERIATKTTSALFSEIEGSHAALAALDPARALMATLRGGIGGELGWPAFEEAMRELDPESKGRAEVHGIYPYVCVSDGARVVAVGPKGRVLTHDLQLPKAAKLASLRCIGGSLRVLYRDVQWQISGYWSHAPSDVFSLGAGHYGLHPGMSPSIAIELEDGAIVEGGRATRRGDRTPSDPGELVYDGVTIWKREFADHDFVLREVDPATGEAGRRSLPELFESGKRDGMKLNVTMSWLYALPPSIERSLLGSENGLVGLRALVRDPKSPHAASVPLRDLAWIDGRRWAGPPGESLWPSALVDWPGDDRRRPIFTDARRHHPSQLAQGAGLSLRDPEGRATLWTGALAPRTSPASMLPLPFWNYFTVRDARGSRALRAIDEAAVRRLYDARREARPKASAYDDPTMLALLGETLPEVSEPALGREILFVVDRAAELADKLAQLVIARDPAAAPAQTASPDVIAPIGEILVPLLGLNVQRADGAAVLEGIQTFSRVARRAARGDGDKTEVRSTSLAWPELVGRIGAVAYLAASPATTASARAALLALLETWADSVLVETERTFTVLTTKTDAIERGHAVTKNGSDFYAGLPSQFSNDANKTVLAHTPPGAKLALPADLTVMDSRSGADAWGTAERIRAFVADVRASGPWAWDPNAVTTLAARTGLTRGEAALALAGFPECSDWGPPLSEPRRTLLGLKLPESKAALAAMRPVSRPHRIAALAGAMPLDPIAVRAPLGSGEDDPESLVARLARAWVAARGRRAAVPDALVAAAVKELKGRGRPQDLLAMFASPDDATQLVKDSPALTFDTWGRPTATDPTAFTPSLAVELAPFIPWLFLTLPVGDPLRESVPRALTLVRARLASPTLLVPFAQQHAPAEQAGWPQRALDLVAAGSDETSRDDGRVLARAKDRIVSYMFRPSRMQSEADWAFVESLRKASYPTLGEGPIRLLLGEGFSAIARRIEHTPVPAGKYEACPLHSVPSLVSAVVARFELSEDAAVLYLQTLALVAPTKKAVETWNEWKGARYGKAAAELVKAELLLEAKRERAGRAHFLPGGWEALDAPFAPVETWKLPLYELTEQGAQIHGPLRLHLALRPLHEIFEAAWKRVEAGDPPRYEEVAKASKKKAKKT